MSRIYTTVSKIVFFLVLCSLFTDRIQNSLRFRYQQFRKSLQQKPKKTQQVNINELGFPKFLLKRKKQSDEYFQYIHQIQTERIDMRGYEDADLKKVHKIINEYQVRERFAFAPFLQFLETENVSETLNIRRDKYGYPYRLNGRHQDSEDLLDIFVFGGSTTFGMHVSDDWTLPSYLELALDRRYVNAHGKSGLRVVNYGQCAYSWFQELVLFQQLLRSGHRPKMAIFIDGVNSFSNGVANTPAPFSMSMFGFQSDPIVRSPEEDVKLVLRSYLNTVKMIRSIGRVYGIETHFFWQPNKGVRCEIDKYRFTGRSPGNRQPLLHEAIARKELTDFYDLTDLCEKFGNERYFFVDDAHYNHHFARFIGERMADLLWTNSRVLRRTDLSFFHEILRLEPQNTRTGAFARG